MSAKWNIPYMTGPKSSPLSCSRREFLCRSAALAALASAQPLVGLAAPTLSPELRANAKVAIVQCNTYGTTVKPSLKECFDLLGGIQKLVRNKTVTVKLNLTGTNFSPYLGRPVGETYMTHPDTVMALTALLVDAGAKRIRYVESTQSKAALQSTLELADWDVKALSNMGKVDFENTRNLGSSKSYAHFKVPNGGLMFASLDLNKSYEETDVMVSLAKLKNHVTAGVTLSMKNCFGLTPNTLYGGQAGTEDATDGRGPLHSPIGYEQIKLPGLKPNLPYKDPFSRVPRIIVDVCAARPINLAIIDGITAMNRGEGPWTDQTGAIKMTKPGLLIVGLNPVSTDAVATAVMGYDNPRAAKGVHPFEICDNHLLLAEEAGLGTADLTKIDVRGMPIAKARYPYG
jgi:uncharacterized protein (DUF362 family)